MFTNGLSDRAYHVTALFLAMHLGQETGTSFEFDDVPGFPVTTTLMLDDDSYRP